MAYNLVCLSNLDNSCNIPNPNGGMTNSFVLSKTLNNPIHCNNELMLGLGTP